jgi:hypothetical protein
MRAILQCFHCSIKTPWRWVRPSRAAALLAATIATAAPGGGLAARDVIPLPRPRPPELGLRALVPIPTPRPREGEPAPEAGPPEPEAPPEISACRRRLSPDLAEIEALPPVSGPNGCGIEDPVSLTAVVGRDRERIAVVPPAVFRCTMAEAVVAWVRDDVAPISRALGAPLKAIANFDSYDCRGRNRIRGAKLSEHGHGNALDVRAVMLTNGKAFELTDRAVSHEVREQLRAAACARFTTVLGPESDGYHENHVHVDLAERRSGYRICQWAVRDPGDLPTPLPRPRPPEAPPREEAAAE